MARIQGTPNLYLHEPGLLSVAGRWIQHYGRHVHIITGYKSWEATGSTLMSSLRQNSIEYQISRYSGDCTDVEVERLCSEVGSSCRVIVGVGGGKLLDTAKAVAAHTSLDFVAIPTLASTCSPVTPVSVIYSSTGEFQKSAVWLKNSALTIVDTQIIAGCPIQYLLSGIGDTLAKWYEGRISAGGHDEFVTRAALQSASLSREIIWSQAVEALDDVANNRTSDSLHSVIDAIFLGAGMVGGIGGESCRAAAAHAFHNGTTVIPSTKQIVHGKKVAYGILIQLALEERHAELTELIEFYRGIKLPISIKDIGVDLDNISRDLYSLMLNKTLQDSSIKVMPFKVTPTLLDDAIQSVESLNKA